VTVAVSEPTMRARQLEVDAEQFPDDRAEILFEAAAAWQDAGDLDRARQQLERIVGFGGVDAGMARVQLAELYLTLRDGEHARAELSALKASREPDPAPYAMAGELFAERDDTRAALTWFNIAATRFSDDEVAEACDPEYGWMTYAAGVLWQRRKARRQLGFLPDELDGALAEPLLRRGEAFPTIQELLSTDALGAAHGVRVLIWPRAEFDTARRRWPQLIEAETTHDAYRTRLEAELRELTEREHVPVTLIPALAGTLGDFATRVEGQVTDAAVRRAHLAEQAAQGNTTRWPPPRNSPCWCGSAIKYKKCCGRVR
jgi:tetratricopeptide (TPR) repeat protein